MSSHSSDPPIDSDPQRRADAPEVLLPHLRDPVSWAIAHALARRGHALTTLDPVTGPSPIGTPVPTWDGARVPVGIHLDAVSSLPAGSADRILTLIARHETNEVGVTSSEHRVHHGPLVGPDITPIVTELGTSWMTGGPIPPSLRGLVHMDDLGEAAAHALETGEADVIVGLRVDDDLRALATSFDGALRATPAGLDGGWRVPLTLGDSWPVEGAEMIPRMKAATLGHEMGIEFIREHLWRGGGAERSGLRPFRIDGVWFRLDESAETRALDLETGCCALLDAWTGAPEAVFRLAAGRWWGSGVHESPVWITADGPPVEQIGREELEERERTHRPVIQPRAAWRPREYVESMLQADFNDARLRELLRIGAQHGIARREPEERIRWTTS